MYYKGSRHYNLILNLKAAAGSRGGYCVACNVGFREKWECEFSREKRENHEMRAFFENHPILINPPLDSREAFFGGRTENIVTRYKVTGTEKIRNVDVCSLYPYVLKTGTFPLDQPTIYIGEQCSELIGAAPNFNFDCVEGIIRCTVLPPRDLFHPVLPYRVQGKLLFGLCHGAWVSCELRKALEKDSRYLREYEKTEGIVFDKNNIVRNPGLCLVAKLCLNSFWDKFGQRTNLPDTEIVKKYDRLAALLTSSEHEIINILPVNDEVIYVSWRLREETVAPSPQTNPIIAAWTMTQARLILYEYLGKLGGERFESPEATDETFRILISEVTVLEWKKCFENWFELMQKCIDLKGEYFEKQ
ncbi:hypothetical protein ALC56_06366 [Trachymyrmex septentrionalis]|uniref:DNA-directed DNA polymerase n=1 Tax=Trachymyrmex septentrionalis TaxID=34720 RepID=A0A151JX08_9HYME|nr:hypothetical protein ALC56_06366 [Trachymyrmex septentrionalis]